jgi:hypothetical protein
MQAKVANLKLKSKLAGMPSESPACQEATLSVQLLLRLADEINFADTEYIKILDNTRALSTADIRCRNAIGLAVLQSLVAYSERVLRIKVALDEDFAKISVVLNMGEEVVTAVLQSKCFFLPALQSLVT